MADEIYSAAVVAAVMATQARAAARALSGIDGASILLGTRVSREVLDQLAVELGGMSHEEHYDAEAHEGGPYAIHSLRGAEGPAYAVMVHGVEVRAQGVKVAQTARAAALAALPDAPPVPIKEVLDEARQTTALERFERIDDEVPIDDAEAKAILAEAGLSEKDVAASLKRCMDTVSEVRAREQERRETAPVCFCATCGGLCPHERPAEPRAATTEEEARDARTTDILEYIR
jgi:hypothetical protein